MRIVVLGGTGKVGSKVVAEVAAQGHEAVVASPSRGVNAYTGEGLAETLAGADAVIDVVNAPAWGDDEALDFFRTSTSNLLSAARAAGVGHLVTLSIVGAPQMPESGYMRAKVAQEELVAAGGQPYSIVRATQFHEFVGQIAESFAEGDVLRVPPIRFQPIAAADVAREVVRVATGAPLNATVEVGGPDVLTIDAAARQYVAHLGDGRSVETDASKTYFGTPAAHGELTTGAGATLATQTYAEWLATAASA